jgi:hypothetical protein
MNITSILVVVALMALLVVVLAVQAVHQKPNTGQRRPHRNGLRRQWRKVYLAPIGLPRLLGWLPGRQVMPRVQFANIGEGTYGHGYKSYIPDAATTARYLLYKKGTDVDHCAICGAGDDPLGPSDDQAGSDSVPIAIALLGAVMGTVRVVTDGTIADGDYVKCGANGQATKATTGDLSFGRARIATDASSAAGDVITIIPVMPAKYAF